MTCNKIRQTCGGVLTYSKCTKYEGILSEHSSLSEDDCLDIEQIAEDLYSIIDAIKEDINLENLENTCITFANKTPSYVIEQMYNKICELQTTLDAQTDLITTMQSQISDLQTQTCP